MVSNYKKNSTVQLIESGELDEIKQYMIDNKLRRLQFLAHKSFLTDSIVRKKLVQRGIDIKDLLSDVNNTLGKPEKHSTKKALALKAAEKKKHLWKINKVRTDHVKKIKRDQKERLFSQVQNITHRKIIKSGTMIELEHLFVLNNCDTWLKAAKLVGIEEELLKRLITQRKLPTQKNKLARFTTDKYITKLMTEDHSLLGEVFKQDKCTNFNSVKNRLSITPKDFKLLLEMNGESIKQAHCCAREQINQGTILESKKSYSNLHLNILANDNINFVIQLFSLKKCYNLTRLSNRCNTSFSDVKSILRQRGINEIDFFKRVKERIEQDKYKNLSENFLYHADASEVYLFIEEMDSPSLLKIATSLVLTLNDAKKIIVERSDELSPIISRMKLFYPENKSPKELKILTHGCVDDLTKFIIDYKLSDKHQLAKALDISLKRLAEILKYRGIEIQPMLNKAPIEHSNGGT